LRNNVALMTARVSCAALFVLLVLSTLDAGRAHAEDVAAAREHYKKGTTYYDLGKYADAAREFEAAYEAKNDAAFLFNLAQSYRLAGDSERALHFYRTYLRYVPRPPNRADIEEQIKTLEQKVAEKQSAATTPPATAPLPPPPTATPTAPPPPIVSGPGAPGTVTTGPAPAPPLPNETAAPTPPPVGPDPGRGYRMAGMITAGAGAVMIVIGAVEGARARSAAKDVEQAAMDGTPFDPDVESRGKSAEKAQWWLLGLGAVAGAAGAGLWYYGHHLTAEARASGTVSFAPVLGPGRTGAVLQVTF